MGSMSEARPAASRLARVDSRPVLVTALVVGWIFLCGFGALRALFVLGSAATTSALGTTDPLARAAAAAPDLVSDETRELLAQRAQRASLERALAIPLLLVATLGVVGAVALLRRRTWSRALLVTVGVLALGISAFHTYRSVEIGAAPAAGLEADPEAQNALALFRAAAGIGLALQSIPLVLAMSLLRHPIVRDYLGVAERRRSGSDPLLIVAGCAVLVAAGAVLLSKSRAPAPAPTKSAPVFHPPEPAETFRWSDQPITFSPPPGSWTRERHAEGGRKGVSFTRYATPPSRIVVAEASVEIPPRTVEEVLPRFRLTREKFPSVDSSTVGDPVPAAVAGFPAFQTDYTLRERSMQHRGREFLTVVAGHVFVITLLGPDADLRVLENLVASVRFPAAGEPAAAPPADAAVTSADEPAGSDVTLLRVGEQRVTARIPPGWEHVDYGKRQEFRHGEARFALFDAGPAQPGPAGEIDDPKVLNRALSTIGLEPRRREIASKTPLRIGGQDALAIDTWEPTSHAYRERFFLVLNAGRLLVAAGVMGRSEDTRVPLDELVRSIRFAN